jgi:hypothetical protein
MQFYLEITVSINYKNVISIFESFLRKSTFCVLKPISRGPVFGAGMFIFTVPRPMTNKLFNELNPSKRLDAKESHVHLSRQTDIHTGFKIPVFIIKGLEMYKSVKILRSIFITPTYFLIDIMYKRK